jgi:Flp pilus assembly pilin Flp
VPTAVRSYRAAAYSAIEYGLIAALISVVCIAAGQQLLAVYDRIGNSLAAAL